MTTECETKTEQKLTRTQWALFIAAVLLAFTVGLIAQAMAGILPSGSGATYDITARNDAAQALRKADESQEANRLQDDRIDRLRSDLDHMQRRIGLPIGAPVGVPKREEQ